MKVVHDVVAKLMVTVRPREAVSGVLTMAIAAAFAETVRNCNINRNGGSYFGCRVANDIDTVGDFGGA